MSGRRPSGLVLACILGLTSCGGGGGGPTTGPDADFHPTTNVSLSGNVSYKSVSIPAGVTVTATSDMVLTVTGDFLLAGTLAAPCHTLSISAGGTLTITGNLQNDCTDPIGDGDQLEVIGKGGYNLDGATITSSGDIWILDGPVHPQPGVGFGPRELRTPPTPAAATTYRCRYANARVVTSPAKAAPGDPGSPDGKPGWAGHAKTFGCGQLLSGQTGGNLLINGLTMSGGSGGDGGKGTSVSTPSHGGLGGAAGAMIIVSDGDIVLNGNIVLNGGDGGRGGDGESLNPAAGGSADATGGKGGGLQPKNFSPVTIQAGGSLTLDGSLKLHLGTAGRGGDALAAGGTGSTGSKGGDAKATGGAGGDSAPITMTASGAIDLRSTPELSGGDGGLGGDASHTPGDGGAGAASGGDGGPGGNASGLAGNGGKGLVNGHLLRGDGHGSVLALNSQGGGGGSSTYHGGNGGLGGNNCGTPAGKGGKGGDGGTAAGGDGLPGTPGGSGGALLVTDGFNGRKGGTGNPGGDGGAKGNGPPNKQAPAPAAFIQNAFLPGPQGDQCPNPVPHVDQVGILLVDPGTGNTTIQVTGTGFVTATVIYYNGIPLTTTFVDAQHVTAVIPSSLNPPATAPVLVISPAPGGGSSNSITFTHPCAPKSASVGQQVNGAVTATSCGGGNRFQEILRATPPASGVLHANLSSSWSNRLIVRGPDGKNVVSETSQTAFNRDLILPAGVGPYDFLVSANDGSAAGAFTFLLSTGSGDSNCQSIPWIADGATTNQMLVTGPDCDLGGGFYRDQYLIELQANQQMFVVVTAGFQPILRLVDATTLQVVRQDNNNGNLLTAQMNFTSTTEHAFFIQVFNKSGAGAYTLNVHH